MQVPGTLFIVATPIGNLQDITLRVLDILKSVDLILAEDTRHTGQILHHFDIKTPMLPFHEFNENQKAPQVIEKLQTGFSIALVSDAGTPLISDPGYKLVRDAITYGIKVVSLPGPSAALAALTSSGLPPDKFLFIGFLPQKPGKRRKLLESLVPLCHASRSNYLQSKIRDQVENDTVETIDADYTLKATIILYESPHHLRKTLQETLEIFGDIPIVIARELTKVHEECFRGSITDAISHFKTPKGEFVILF